MLNTIYIGLGSNVGDRQYYLDTALEKLSLIQDIEVTLVSSYLNTKAVAASYQPDYLNAVAEIKTLLSCRQFFDYTIQIEQSLGRLTKGTYDPRTIDIDILFFNHDIIIEDDLVVPHPLCHERRFVLEPLIEVCPNFVHPLLNQTVDQLCNSCYETTC